jgi:hypothetical protein
LGHGHYSKKPTCQKAGDSMSLTYVKYVDHVKFNRCDHSAMKPDVREVIGWLLHETNDAIYICYDRSVKPLPLENLSEDGLVILKSDVLERKEVERSRPQS